MGITLQSLHRGYLCGEAQLPDILQNPPKSRFRREAHGSIRIQDGDRRQRLRLWRVRLVTELTERMTEQLISIHPDMPDFRFTGQEAKAIRSYLYSIQR